MAEGILTALFRQTSVPRAQEGYNPVLPNPVLTLGMKNSVPTGAKYEMLYPVYCVALGVPVAGGYLKREVFVGTVHPIRRTRVRRCERLCDARAAVLLSRLGNLR